MKLASQFIPLCASAAFLLLSLPAHANLALAEKSACLNCHDVEKKMVGPAFKAISDKYKARTDANSYLAEKIRKGGSGVWGSIPMPGMPQVAEADVNTLTAWIIQGAPR